MGTENTTSFDIIIPIAKKDISFVRYTIDSLVKHLLNFDGTIYLITNSDNFKKCKSIIANDRVQLVDENKMISELSYNNVKHALLKSGLPKAKVGMTGWYFQQFLKLGFAKSKYARKWYLSWDADTLLLNDLSFFNENGNPYFTKKTEYHKEYFDTLQNSLNLSRQVDYSFIAEHMMFNSDVVKAMLLPFGSNWYKTFVDACEFECGDWNLFSEFETYGNYVAVYYPTMYNTRTLNTFRAAGMIRGRYVTPDIIRRLAFDLQTASFEPTDALFPWNIKYMAKVFWRKIIILMFHPRYVASKLLKK